MGQSRATRAQGTPDTVITGAVILDHWGVVKADVGIRDGRIVAIGRAGNPDTMDGVHPDLVIGPCTEIIAGNGRILTAGAEVLHGFPTWNWAAPNPLTENRSGLIGKGVDRYEGKLKVTGDLTIRDVTKLRGEVQVQPPGSLPRPAFRPHESSSRKARYRKPMPVSKRSAKP